VLALCGVVAFSGFLSGCVSLHNLPGESCARSSVETDLAQEHSYSGALCVLSSTTMPTDATAGGSKAGKAGKAQAPPAASKQSLLLKIIGFFRNLKMFHVVKYVLDLVKDLWAGRHALLDKRNSRDNAKRLLAMVWPEKWIGSSSNTDAKTRKYFLVMVAVGLVNLFLMEKCSGLTSHLTTALYKRQNGRVKTLLVKSLQMSAGIALASSALSWATTKMEVLWRSKITRKLHSLYFDNMAYYHITKLKKTNRRTGKKSLTFPHPDERLAGEVFQATKRIVNMIVALTQSLPLLFWFTLKLWRQKGVSFAVLPHLYLFVAYEIVQRYLPKNFFILNTKLTKARNAYNSAVARLETNSEAIAAVGGASVEESTLFRLRWSLSLFYLFSRTRIPFMI